MNYNLIHLLLKEAEKDKELNKKINVLVLHSLSDYTKRTTTTLDLRAFNRESLEEAISKFKENSSELH